MNTLIGFLLSLSDPVRLTGEKKFRFQCRRKTDILISFEFENSCVQFNMFEDILSITMTTFLTSYFFQFNFNLSIFVDCPKETEKGLLGMILFEYLLGHLSE